MLGFLLMAHSLLEVAGPDLGVGLPDWNWPPALDLGPIRDLPY